MYTSRIDEWHGQAQEGIVRGVMQLYMECYWHTAMLEWMALMHCRNPHLVLAALRLAEDWSVCLSIALMLIGLLV